MAQERLQEIDHVDDPKMNIILQNLWQKLQKLHNLQKYY